MTESTRFPTVVTGFGYSPIAPALWNSDGHKGLELRDLSLQSASGEAFLGQHMRATGDGTLCIDPSTVFIFLFVLSGEISIGTNDGPIPIYQRDAATRYGPASESCRLFFSKGAEFLMLMSSEGGQSQFGRSGSGQWEVSRDSRDVYIAGDGPRQYFLYRDLGTARATERRIHIHIVEATRAVEGGTGWHAHSMGQLFYVLRGWADLRVEHRPSVKMLAGDAMCLAAGMKHDVPAFAANYAVIEMCVPADYETVDASEADVGL